MCTRILIVVVLLFGLQAGMPDVSHAGDEITDLEWYFSMGFGPAFGKGFADEVRQAAAANPLLYTQEENSGGGGRLLIGYPMDDKYGLEVFFALNGGYGGDIGITGYTVDVQGFGVSGIRTMPFGTSGKWAGFGRIGLYRWEVTKELEIPGPDLEVSATGIAPMIGLGVTYGRYKDVFLRWEIEYYPNVGDKAKTGQSDIFVIMFPLSFALGF